MPQCCSNISKKKIKLSTFPLSCHFEDKIPTMANNCDGHDKSQNNSGPCLISAFLCIYQALDFEDCIVGCKGKSQLLCLTREVACAVGEPTTGCGMVTNPDNKECCKIGCVFCSHGCKEPETCTKGAVQICCLKEAVALPCDKEHLDEPVCAHCCLACAPKFGCCVRAPRCPALEKPVFECGPMLQSVATKEMDRDAGVEMSEPCCDGPILAKASEVETCKDESETSA